ncbi:unnamed protein product [Heligmosomoides polygyrus]|uniref:Cwf21 domain-containing protein n=1 Tax=Heligmosomoides polygyrus TaxID=6339 RepID=A0A183F6Q8_HELPZ|nr:unnamed protein product [Heligmosomoides polygyrus]
MTKSGKPRYVEVDIVALMNAIRPRGSKFSVDRKRVEKLLEEGAKRMISEVDLVREDRERLAREVEKLKRKLEAASMDQDESTPHSSKKKRSKKSRVAVAYLMEGHMGTRATWPCTVESGPSWAWA